MSSYVQAVFGIKMTHFIVFVICRYQLGNFYCYLAVIFSSVVITGSGVGHLSEEFSLVGRDAFMVLTLKFELPPVMDHTFGPCDANMFCHLRSEFVI